MVKTCEVKVDKKTYTVNYDTDEYEKLICEVSVSAKEGRNAFKCIHCKAKFTSKQRLNYHRLKGCYRAFDSDGKPLKLLLYPSVTSGGAVEVRDILEKNNLHVRNTFKCIHCNQECVSKQQLDYHCRRRCPGVDINGQLLQLKLLPSLPSGGAVEVRDILEKNDLHVRNTFKCIHCNEEYLLKRQLNYHCRKLCPGVLDINGQALQLKLLPSLPSGGAAEFRNISEKHNFHGICEPEGSDLLASFGEDVLHGNPSQLPRKDGSELPDAASVTPIVYKEHPESHPDLQVPGSLVRIEKRKRIESIMVKTCKVKVDKKTYTVDYDTDEYEKLSYEGSVSAKEGRNAFNCIHCSKECASKYQLNYHCSMGCTAVLGINGQPLQLKLFPPVPSGGAAEVRDILETQNLHRACELEESNQLASSDEDVLHGSPLQLPCKDGSELPDAACVTPIVYKEHPESHDVSAEFRDISEKHNFLGVCEPEECDQLAGFGEDVIPHGSPLQLLWEDGSELPDVLCVTPTVYKEHPESHEVSFLVMDGLSFSPIFVYQEELDKEAWRIYQGGVLFDFMQRSVHSDDVTLESLASITENLSKLELDQLVKTAPRYSLYRYWMQAPNVEALCVDILVTIGDFKLALQDVNIWCSYKHF